MMTALCKFNSVCVLRCLFCVYYAGFRHPVIRCHKETKVENKSDPAQAQTLGGALFTTLFPFLEQQVTPCQMGEEHMRAPQRFSQKGLTPLCVVPPPFLGLVCPR